MIDFEVFVKCFEDPEDGVRGNVVSFLNHGPFHSTLVILPILLKITLEHGLHKERPGLIFHKIVHYIPALRTIAKRLTGGHTATSVDEAVRNLRYTPGINREQYERESPRGRRVLIAREASRMREIMQREYDQL